MDDVTGANTPRDFLGSFPTSSAAGSATGLNNSGNSAELIRSQLWSPVQNTALWMAWWLHGIISTDEVIDAFHAVQGRHHRLLYDAKFVNRGTKSTSEDSTGLSDLLKAARQATENAPVGIHQRPLVSLVLAGAGDAPLLPKGEAADAVAKAGASLVFADENPHVHHVAVPTWVDRSVVYWTWFTAVGRAPNLSVHSPGDADMVLRQAMADAQQSIDATGIAALRGQPSHPAPRLAVGELSDAFGLPGLPVGVASRAEKLMARADVVAAIIETGRNSSMGHSLDPHLLPLMRAIRLARMVAVDYAQREILR